MISIYIWYFGSILLALFALTVFIILLFTSESAKLLLYSINSIIIYNSNNKIIKDILGIIVNQIVTIVGLSEYTSGDQLCKGAAPILKKNPININTIPKLIPCITPVFSVTDIKLYIESKLVKPV